MGRVSGFHLREFALVFCGVRAGEKHMERTWAGFLITLRIRHIQLDRYSIFGFGDIWTQELQC